MDLIRTLEDDDEVTYFSENSDSDNDAQPTKKLKGSRERASRDFDSGFEFCDSQEQYVKDTWNDLSRYLKKKARTTLEEKIAKVRGEIKRDEDDKEEEQGSGSDLSEDELVPDNLRVKEKDARKKERKKRKTKGSEEGSLKVEGQDGDDFFEELDLAAASSSDSFYSMNLSRPLLKAIEALRFVHPTPIQAATVPAALAGRDVCGCAATGTGKTAAYMLPVLERLLLRPRRQVNSTIVLVLVPTRELGVQVYQVSRQLAQFTNTTIGLSVGGLDLKAQEDALKKSPDIVIATPGRLIDHLQNTPTFTLDSIEVREEFMYGFL